MTTRTLASKVIIVGAAGIFCGVAAALAADTAAAQSTSKGSTKVQATLVTQFSGFAGSDENAQNLVTGLRQGAPITLSSPPPAPGQPAASLTFDTPTRPMGYGNVSISLALAKQQLANLGITDPTPQQIQAALTGGTVTTGSGATTQLPGILTLRSEGMGWGKIAKSQGMNLGQVVSGLKSAKPEAAAGGTVVNANAAAGGSRSSNAHARANETSGIVTAAGTSVAVHGDQQFSGGGQAGGIVRGDGTVTGARGSGLAKGQGRP
jgi:hypothetical protein